MRINLADESQISSFDSSKSEPNEASHWKITLQKRENYYVDTGAFIPALTWFLYILLCRKCVLVYGRGHITCQRR
jgi:hypothetical protein